MGILSHVGTLAAVCTTGAFIPQIIKIKKQGGDDLSYAMLVFYLLGVLLWLAYGLMLHAPALIWANGATAFLVLVAAGAESRIPRKESRIASRGALNRLHRRRSDSRWRFQAESGEPVATCYHRCKMTSQDPQFGVNLLGRSVEELRQFMESLGEPGYRGAQIYHALVCRAAIRYCGDYEPACRIASATRERSGRFIASNCAAALVVGWNHPLRLALAAPASSGRRSGDEARDD